MNFTIRKLQTKINKAISRIFPKKPITLANWLELNNFTIEPFSEIESILKSTLAPIYLRNKGSDNAVFFQVFVTDEYKNVINLIADTIKTPQLIIDCGANIGLTALKLAKAFPYSKVLSIEPDINNFNQLVKNTALLPNIKPMHNAVWSNFCQIQMDSSFRDGQDWSKHTSESDIGEINAITIVSIIENEQVEFIDFLKIDIEGAEKEIFKDLETASFLSKTKILALEIHDEFNIRKHIYSILKAYNFDFYNDIELTIAINKNLVK